jgi:hypothetical protein
MRAYWYHFFVGRTPFLYTSKRQGTAEESSYDAEFIVGHISVEEVIALRGVLRALGVPVMSPTKWYGDNLGMLQSSNIPEATWKKRHVNIAYHMFGEKKRQSRNHYYLLHVFNAKDNKQVY